MFHLKGLRKKLVGQWLLIFLGSAVFAASVDCFTVPNQIAPGGLTGIATVLNYLVSALPIGTTVLVLNIPLLILAVLQMGWRFTARTVAGTVVSSLFIDLLAVILPAYTENRLMAALFGGILSGVGLAMILSSGATTGGTDLAAKLIGRRLRHIPLGRLLFCFDFIVVIIAAVVFRNLESALYACVTLFITSWVLDEAMYGLGDGSGKVVFIITNQGNSIAERIMKELERGVTILPSRGAYTKSENTTLLCALRRNELYQIRDIVHQEDPHAFMMIGTAEQIVGESFAPINEKEG